MLRVHVTAKTKGDTEDEPEFQLFNTGSEATGSR